MSRRTAFSSSDMAGSSDAAAALAVAGPAPCAGRSGTRIVDTCSARGASPASGAGGDD